MRRTFKRKTDARSWRAQATVELRAGGLVRFRRVTVEQACREYLQLARDGEILNRKRDRYKPGTVHSYEQSLRLRVYERIGQVQLSQLDRVRLQDLVDGLVADGCAPPTVHGAITPLKAVYGRALKRREVAIDPTRGLDLPRVRSRRERIAPAAEGERLIAALQPRDQAVWATAMYGGLRRGELMALRVSDVELDARVIHVCRSYDPRAREFAETKNRESRKVPIPEVLAQLLRKHLFATGRRGDALVFGVTATRPFSPTQVYKRARDAWGAARPKLKRITLHECRHSYASLMIAAGVNAKALSIYMGHFSVAFTLDQYGHLMPGNEDEAALLLDQYLTRTVAPIVARRT